MSRAERRASVSSFKREAAGGYLDVCLAPTDAPISEPFLERAAVYWRAGVAVRKPTCVGCKAKFAETASVGAFLFTVPSRAPTAVSVSAICDVCWATLSDAQVKAAALRIVRQVMPRAVFDAEPPQ